MKRSIVLIMWFGMIGCANPFSDFNPSTQSNGTSQKDILDELVCYTMDKMLECYSITGWFVSTRSGLCFAKLFIELTSHYKSVASKWGISEEEIQNKMKELEDAGSDIKTKLQNSCNQIEEEDKQRQCKMNLIHQMKQDSLDCK